MTKQSKNVLKTSGMGWPLEKIEASAPCRVDIGGTLDISTFYYPLCGLAPCTVNLALNLRTRVTLIPNSNLKVKVSSRGFKSAEYAVGDAPFQHPLGLMFAVAAFFRAEGVHILIDSVSPPQSALGGSSVAAVALVAAFAKARGQIGTLTPALRTKIAILAHEIEASVAGVPCGLQDQLAAAFGGGHAWYWQAGLKGSGFRRRTLLDRKACNKIGRHLLLAYCGIPHESKNINSRWVGQFLKGSHRDRWQEIVLCTHRFAEAITVEDYSAAAAAMNRETAIRRKMTPDVLDAVGRRLVDAAVRTNCGARFAGAGGGGCIWALGHLEDIDRLRGLWETILSERTDARLLAALIDTEGLSLTAGP
ncbi:MAG: galactokinase [Desulfobacterales bacterium]|nr:galactokinase [Desulfobacterales bacterium]